MLDMVAGDSHERFSKMKKERKRVDGMEHVEHVGNEEEIKLVVT